MQNDYSYMDSLLSNLPTPVLNEAAVPAPAPVTNPSTPVTNPPAETVNEDTKWLDDSISALEEVLKTYPNKPKVKQFLDELKAMKGTMKEAKEQKAQKITITINTGNADFQGNEEAAIKKALNDLMSRGIFKATKVMDANGNSIGTVDVEDA